MSEPEPDEEQHHSAEEFTDWDPSTAPKDFLGIIAAPRRHGKTTALTDWLRVWHKQKRFTHCMVFSKTLSGYEGYIPANYQWDNLQNVEGILDRQMDVAEYNAKREKKEDMVHSSILLILDDMASEQKEIRTGETGRLMRSIACNGRHICREDPLEKNECSCIILTQQLTLYPPSIRNNCDFICSSRLANRFERERLVHESLTLRTDREGMKKAYQVLDDVTLSKPYRMIIIEKHKANRQVHPDYVYYYDADAKAKGVRLFGTERDWQVKKKRIRI